ncbi:hypothetical protein AKJ37_01945 [candidate division MSBL1 archaeon SCGC-AAA259I09]|uniref:DUF3368 domain-containing protein n=3 Tax=candidate division MSBL1 TaxID=215777 RepID=A0A133UUM3_9EURY|nr:hypothetical protein AKJ62_03490 [candidate division MSBL1 archaeon SCGC-AAA259D14]KXA89538.1 hypothetical protein AKJ61_02660 [candidate division MSBL1 archaeon SCGC-AAA259B11]KXA97913.1 hypothetical protein AKJ37_01945 [candidate division MSBL1 archaeon SCGC-AAA259I09]
MSTIVLNTSGLSALIKIDALDLLENMFPKSDIIIPTGVLKEFNKKFKHKPNFIEERELNEIQRRRANSMDLGRGEREVIVLAEDSNGVVIMDEGKGRKECEKRGIEYIGVLGIIREGYIDCLLSEKERNVLIERIENSNFYYKEHLIEWVLDAKKRDSN